MIARIDVENVLLKMGVPAGIKGFKYITDAVLIMDKQDVKSITKELYPMVASMNGTTASKTERAIRHAFEVARSKRGNPDEVGKYIGFMNCTNNSSLKMLHMKLKQEPISENHKHETDGLTEETIRQIFREEFEAVLGRFCENKN